MGDRKSDNKTVTFGPRIRSIKHSNEFCRTTNDGICQEASTEVYSLFQGNPLNPYCRAGSDTMDCCYENIWDHRNVTKKKDSSKHLRRMNTCCGIGCGTYWDERILQNWDHVSSIMHKCHGPSQREVLRMSPRWHDTPVEDSFNVCMHYQEQLRAYCKGMNDKWVNRMEWILVGKGWRGRGGPIWKFTYTSDSCGSAKDGVCDEDILCPRGTDSTDCAASGTTDIKNICDNINKDLTDLIVDTNSVSVNELVTPIPKECSGVLECSVINSHESNK